MSNKYTIIAASYISVERGREKGWIERGREKGWIERGREGG